MTDAPDPKPKRARKPRAPKVGDDAPPAEPKAKKRAKKPRQAPQPCLFPRLILGIDPARVGGAALIWHPGAGPAGEGREPHIVALAGWTERDRSRGKVVEVSAWAESGPTTLELASWGALGHWLARSMAADLAACEAQYAGRFAGAGLAVALIAGLTCGPIEAHLGGRVAWAQPKQWRAVARIEGGGGGKGDPLAIAAQLGGWPDGSLAALGPTAEHVAEALGVAIWAAASL